MFTELQLENWTNVDLVLKAMMIAGLAWLVLTIFIYWRRRATNLTPVDMPCLNPAAQPDFLSINQEKMESALKRGDQFDEILDRREQIPGELKTAKTARSICGYIAVTLSVLSMLIVVAGSIWPTSVAGQSIVSDSNEGHLIDVVQSYPIAISIALFAICISIWHLAVGRKPKMVSA